MDGYGLLILFGFMAVVGLLLQQAITLEQLDQRRKILEHKIEELETKGCPHSSWHSDAK